MAHLSDQAVLLGRSAAGAAGLVFRVRFRLAPARAPRQILIGLLFGLLIGYRHKAVVHPDRRPAVVGKSSETRSVFLTLQQRVVLGSFLARAIAGPASYQGWAGDQGAIALGPPRLGTRATHRERDESTRYKHSGHQYVQASHNCPSLPCWGSPFRATILALAGARLLLQMSNFCRYVLASKCGKLRRSPTRHSSRAWPNDLIAPALRPCGFRRAYPPTGP
jgi:hypothetical protein